MNITQTHKEFDLFVDKVDSQVTPDFLAKEKDVFIHEAEVRLIKQKYGRGNKYQKGYQENQKRTDDLDTLIKSVVINVVNGFVTLPPDYMFYLGASANVLAGTTRASVPPILATHDNITKLVEDPFVHGVIMLQQNKQFEILPKDDLVVESVKLRYIKYPRRVSKADGIDSELPEQTQREAIQLAVTIALESVESQRMGTNPEMLNTIE